MGKQIGGTPGNGEGGMMNHNGLDTGILRASIDGEIDSAKAAELREHVESCAQCQAEFKTLKANAAGVREGLDRLPNLLDDWSAGGAAVTWAAFQRQKVPAEIARPGWNVRRGWSLAGAGVVVVAVALLFTLAPVRSWAESFLAIFRVEHFAVLEVNPDTMKAKGLNDEGFFNQTVGRILSDEITVTEAPRLPVPVADAAIASQLTGFKVQLIAGETPSALLFRGGATAQMKLDRDRLQSILDEAGRNDLQIPESADGAVLGVHVPPGILAFYGNCGEMVESAQGKIEGRPGQPGQQGDDTCVTLVELRSPSVSAPQQLDPAQIAQVALRFMGMSADNAASFTQTVDWTSTLVLPVVRGESSYEKVQVGGNEGVLLRPAWQKPNDHFNLMWVDSGVLYSLAGTGDDTKALNLASQLE
jgi:hypothetical protein